MKFQRYKILLKVLKFTRFFISWLLFVKFHKNVMVGPKNAKFSVIIQNHQPWRFFSQVSWLWTNYQIFSYFLFSQPWRFFFQNVIIVPKVSLLTKILNFQHNEILVEISQFLKVICFGNTKRWIWFLRQLTKVSNKFETL